MAAKFDQLPPGEIVALQLLRRMVKPEVFRRYLKYGFVSVVGASGLEYRIFRTRYARIEVRDRDLVVARLCIHVHSKHNVPLTDEVVAKMLICEMDEPDIWRRSNAAIYADHPQAKLLKAVAA